jgi:hypothetical protein
VLNDFRAQYVLIVLFSIILDAFECIGELGKDSTHQELFRQREGFDIGVGYVKELRLQILREVEVSEVLVTLHHVGEFVVFSIYDTT